MEPSDRIHSVYPLCKKNWYQSQLNGGRALLRQCNQKVFQILNRLGRWKLSWFNFRLELNKKVRWYLHTWIHPNRIEKSQYRPPVRPQDTPHLWNKHVYGKHIQLATQQSSAPKINSIDTNRVQSINGTFLYYSWEVDPTILTYLNEISTFQSTPTQYKMDKLNQVLDYASTHPNKTIHYHTRDVMLMTDIDAAYLVLLEGRSHIAGCYYFLKPYAQLL